MPIDGRPSENIDETLNRVLRLTREPFVSLVESVGFSEVMTAMVSSARRIVESRPQEFGVVMAAGVRDHGTLWYVGQAVDEARKAIGYDPRDTPGDLAVGIPARAFVVIAYRHPYFDANKRTAFVSAMLIGHSMGFGIRSTPYSHLEEDVRALTAREAPDEEIAAWMLRNLFIRRSGRKV